MSFREIWFVDFEFCAPAGERPLPLCVVAREWSRGRLIRAWLYDNPPAHPPYSISDDSLVVAYYTSAEMGCHLALNWPMPVHIVDLYAEFRNHRSGLETSCGYSLLGALAYFGLDVMDAAEKDEMRQLAQRGGPFSPEESDALLNYCQSDVDSLKRLFDVMHSRVDLPRALLRGRYTAALARMEWNGTPIDTDALQTFRTHWEDIQEELIATVDAGRGIYEGRSFRSKHFERWLIAVGIPWPRLDSGALDLSDDCFREMDRAYPDAVGPIRELRHALSQLRLEKLAVGRDGRNRCLLSAFSSRTGRNQPSNTAFIFGPSVWLRSLIRPTKGRAVAYIDYSQQEFGIAAALSGDPRMQEAYISGDPYLTFAKQAGAVPEDATPESHKAERDQFKTLSLGVQYSMGPESLARRLNTSVAQGRRLIRLHRETYPRYWQWSDAVEMTGMLGGSLTTVFGWKVHVAQRANPRSLRNFPLQANGAEMLRLACIAATEAGIQVCAPVHDAVLIESIADRIEDDIVRTQTIMRRASEVVLGGFSLRTDAQTVRYPDRYVDKRGREFWETVCRLVDAREVRNRPPVVTSVDTCTSSGIGHPMIQNRPPFVSKQATRLSYLFSGLGIYLHTCRPAVSATSCSDAWGGTSCHDDQHF